MRALALLVVAGCSGPASQGRAPQGSALLDTAVPTTRAIPHADRTHRAEPPPLHAPAEVTVRTSGPITCADAAARAAQPYDTRRLPYADDRAWIRMWGAGAVAADFDADGLTDVMFFGGASTATVRHGADGDLVETTSADLATVPPLDEGFGGSVADYDADGDLDVYVTRYARPNVLLRNDGTGTFVDATDRLPLGLGAHRSGSSAWADYDRDGDLDLFVSGHGLIIEDGRPTPEFPPGEPSYLFENTGAGFVDRSDLLPDEIHRGYTFVGGWHDLDVDGWPDLWAINDIGGGQQPCTVVHNQGGTSFVPDHNASGLDLAVAGMGLGVGDVNGDGADDFVVPAWNEVRFMLSTGPVWIDHSKVLGVHGDRDANQVVGWGAEIVDIDNDGDLDVPMVFGYIDTQLSPNRAGQPDALFVQDAHGGFTDRAVEWGVADAGYARGLVVADLNGDGWLDLVKPDIDGPRVLHLSRCGDAAWLRVALRSGGRNTHGVGATITVEADGQVQYRRIYAGGTSYASAGPPEAHFGLGAAATVDRLTIAWPDGATTTLDDVAPRQVLTVVRD